MSLLTFLLNCDFKNSRFFLFPVFISFFITCFSSIASAGVIIYDDVTLSGNPVKLKALTKGRFFAEGGKLVKFYVDGKHIGTNLSGSDGYAFLKYLPTSAGIKTLKVESADETDEGILLVTEKNNRVLLIEIERSLIKSLFSLKPDNEGKEALKKILKNFRIIYLSTLIGVKSSKKWLKDNSFPLSIVLKWEGEKTINELNERKIKLYAIVGSPDILSESSDIKKRFSFQETENGTVVKDWEDMLKHLTEGKPQ